MSHPLEETFKKRATSLGLGGNIFLFLLKIVLGVLSGSIAVISDAIHSLMDIVAAIAITIGVKVANQKADEDHPFGHQRAEPIAGLIIAVIAGILAFEIVRESIFKMITGSTEIVGSYALTALIITLLTKLAMGWYFRRLGKKIHSSAVKALAVDSKNDVLATSVALIGVLVATLGFPAFDSVAGLVVAVFIFKGGYEIGIDNIDYLMGKSADEDLISEIKLTALSVKDVIALNTIRSHYIGQTVQVEIHIEVEHKMPTDQSHYIAEKVEAEIEKIPGVSKAFVHVDPVVLLPDGTRKIADFHKKFPHLE